MTKAKTTKRALLMSVISMLLCVSMLVGSTFAWFTDTVTSGTNRIVAGNLDVELYHTNGIVTTEEKVTESTTLFVNKGDGTFQWEPGAMLYENFTVKNEGSLALKYQMTLIADCNTANGVSLADVLRVAVLDEAFNGDRAAAQAQDFSMTVAEFVKKGSIAASGEIAAKSEDTPKAVIIYWQPSDKDDNYNFNNGKEGTLEINLGVNLVATQNAVENDSFGKDYDEGLAYPTLPAVINTTVEATIDPEGDTVLKDELTGVTATIPEGALGEDVQTVILSVKTEECNVNSVTYEISLADENGESVKSDAPITVALEIGKGLKNVKVNHKGEPMAADDYSYSAATGVVTIKTTSFSPFTIMFEQKDSSWAGDIDEDGLEQNTDEAAKTVHIDTPEQLAALAQSVNSGNTYVGYTVTLTSDINLGNVNWTPIGDGSHAFEGTFDGNDCKISNLQVDVQTDRMSGLFGWVKGTVKKLTVSGATVKNAHQKNDGGTAVGVIAGKIFPSAQILNCKVENATVYGYHNVGGIAGYMYGRIQGCTVENTKISCVNGGEGFESGDKVGGIIGYCGDYRSYVVDNTVRNVQIDAGRDAGQVIGCHYRDYYREMVVNNTIVNVTVTNNGTGRGDNINESEIGRLVGL